MGSNVKKGNSIVAEFLKALFPQQKRRGVDFSNYQTQSDLLKRIEQKLEQAVINGELANSLSPREIEELEERKSELARLRGSSVSGYWENFVSENTSDTKPTKGNLIRNSDSSTDEFSKNIIPSRVDNTSDDQGKETLASLWVDRVGNKSREPNALYTFAQKILNERGGSRSKKQEPSWVKFIQGQELQRSY